MSTFINQTMMNQVALQVSQRFLARFAVFISSTFIYYTRCDKSERRLIMYFREGIFLLFLFFFFYILLLSLYPNESRSVTSPRKAKARRGRCERICRSLIQRILFTWKEKCTLKRVSCGKVSFEKHEVN